MRIAHGKAEEEVQATSPIPSTPRSGIVLDETVARVGDYTATRCRLPATDEHEAFAVRRVERWHADGPGLRLEQWRSTSDRSTDRDSVAVACVLQAIGLLDGTTDEAVDLEIDGTRILVARVDGDVRIELRAMAEREVAA